MKKGARKKPRKRVFLHLLLAALIAACIWGGIYIDGLRQQYGWDFFTAQKYEQTDHFANNFRNYLLYIDSVCQNAADNPNSKDRLLQNLLGQNSSV